METATVLSGHIVLASKHAQLCLLHHVIQSDILTIIISMLNYFVLFNFHFQLCLNFGDCLSCIHLTCVFLCLLQLLLFMQCPCIQPFYYMGSGLPLLYCRT